MSDSPVTAVLTYNIKLWLASLTAALFIPLSLAGLAVDVLLRRDLRTGLSGRILRTSAELEAAIDVHGNLTDIRVLDADEPDAPATYATA